MVLEKRREVGYDLFEERTEHSNLVEVRTSTI